MLTWARLCVDVVTASSPSECDAAGGAPEGPVDIKGKVDVQEIAAADGRALAIFADAGALAAFGRNPLDPACRIPSAQAGRAQGRREAARIATFLGL